MKFSIADEHRNASGVYIIRNTINDKVYVGSAINFINRFYQHRSSLIKRTHHSATLQRFVNKYGIDKIEFCVLEITEKVKCIILDCEQKWINFYQSFISFRGYNISPTAASSFGVKHSARSRLNNSLAAKKRVKNFDSIEKMHEGVRKMWARLEGDERKKSPESIKKRTATRKAKYEAGLMKKTNHTPEGLKRIAEAQRQYWERRRAGEIPMPKRSKSKI